MPWYRTPGGEAGLWLGLPSWVTVAIVCYLGAAVLNALAWSLTPVRDDEAQEGRNAARGGEGTGR